MRHCIVQYDENTGRCWLTFMCPVCDNRLCIELHDTRSKGQAVAAASAMQPGFHKMCAASGHRSFTSVPER